MNRRKFLATSGATLAISPGPLRAAPSRSTPTGLIDCQSHLFSPDMLEMMKGLLRYTNLAGRYPDEPEYLKSVWLDIVSPLPLAMKFAVEFMGADRLLYASDHPWVEPKLIRDGLRSLNLSPDDERKILEVNARKLFGV